MLSPAEAALFAEANPAGFILFNRNIVDPVQVVALTASLRSCVGRADVAILIDQEGGRVCRLKPPTWPEFPSADSFGALYKKAPMTAIGAVRENARALGSMLNTLGINVNCAPVLDTRYAETHDAIGDRSFGHDPNMIAALGRATLDGMADAGVTGVIKHIPGQGRAVSDSHVDLPFVTATATEMAADLIPFEMLRTAQAAMVSHIVYSAWDQHNPASCSKSVIGEVIRGKIGFDGLLFSDDITMKALSGSMSERANACLNAGIDVVLHCSADLDDMREIANHVPEMTQDAKVRLDIILSTSKSDVNHDMLANAIMRRDALMQAV